MFKGPIDDVVIIDKALSPIEVMELYKLYEDDFEPIVGLSHKNVSKNMVIAPNPVNNVLIIRNVSDLTKIEIYSITGQMVKTITNQKLGTIRYNINDLPVGYYVVKGYNNNVINTGSFIKK